eukprot:gene25870-biopygen11014
MNSCHEEGGHDGIELEWKLRFQLDSDREPHEFITLDTPELCAGFSFYPSSIPPTTTLQLYRPKLLHQ